MRYRMKKEVKSVLAFAMAVLLSLSPLGGMRWSVEKTHAVGATAADFFNDSYTVYEDEERNTVVSTTYTDDTLYYITYNVKTDYQTYLGTTVNLETPVLGSVLNDLNASVPYPAVKLVDSLPIYVTYDGVSVTDSVIKLDNVDITSDAKIIASSTDPVEVNGGKKIDVEFDAPLDVEFSGCTASGVTNATKRHWTYTISDIDLLKGKGEIVLTKTDISTFSISGTNIASVVSSNTGYTKTSDSEFYLPMGDDTYTITITPDTGFVLTSITGVDPSLLPGTAGGSYDLTITAAMTGPIVANAQIELTAPPADAIGGAYIKDGEKWYTDTETSVYKTVTKAADVPPSEYSGYDLQYAIGNSSDPEGVTWNTMVTSFPVTEFAAAPNDKTTKYLFLRYGKTDRSGPVTAIPIQIDNRKPVFEETLVVTNANTKTVEGQTQYWGKTNVTLTIPVTDSDSGLKTVQYAFTDDNETDPGTLTDLDLNASNPYSISYEITDKKAYLYVKATDNVGNSDVKYYSLSNIHFDKQNPDVPEEGTTIKYYSSYSATDLTSNVEITDLSAFAKWQPKRIYVAVTPNDPASEDATDGTEVSGIKEVKLTLSDGTVETVTAADAEDNYVFVLTDGQHTITKIEVFDHAGNSSTQSLGRTIKVDETGITDPQVVLQPDQTAYKSVFDVNAIANSLSGIKEVTYVYRENGVEITGSKQVYTGTDISVSGVIYQVLAQAPESLLDQKRELTVLVTFKDACDRTVTVESNVFSYNTKGSEIAFENTDSAWKAADIEIPIHINDITGIESVTISVNDTPVDAVRTDVTDTSEAYTYTLTENSPSTGTKVSVSVVNKAGDTTLSEFLYRLDKQAPVVTLSGIANDSKNHTDQTLTIGLDENIWNEMTVTAVASRTMDGTKHDIDLGTITAQSSSYSIEKAFSEEGIYDVQITAQDAAGNTDQKSIHFLIDKTAPIVDFKNKDGSWTNQDIFVPIQVTEGLSGLGSIVITENGNEITPTVVNETKSERNYVFTLTDNSPEAGTKIVVTATNEAGVTSTTEYTYRLDKQAPTLNLSGVINGNIYNINQSVTVRAEDNIWADMKPVVITATRLLDGVTTEQDLGSFAMNSASTSNSRSFTEDGVYQVTATATDAAGNQTVQTIGFTLDKTAPVLSISGTPDGSYNGNPVTLNFAAVESFYETDNVTISVERRYEGSTYSSRVNFVNTAKNSNVSNTFATDGEYTVVMTATDRAGNTATEQTLHFTLDVTAPAISVIGTKDYLVTKDKVSIQFSVTESYYETNQVRITGTRKGADGKQTNLNIEGWANTGKTSSLSQEYTEDGYYTITIESTDRAGNRRSETIHFTIDTQPPVIAELGQYNGKYLKKFVLEEALEDLISELTSPTVKMTLNGSVYDGREITEDGKYTLIIEVTDEVGLTTTRTVEFIIDNTPPKVIFAGVQDGKTYTDPIRLNITLENENDTIDSITINNEQQDMQGKTSYDYAFNNFDDYIVTVYTSDEAGNTNSQTISFRYAEHTTTSYLWIFIAAATVATGLIIGLIIVGVRKKRG